MKDSRRIRKAFMEVFFIVAIFIFLFAGTSLAQWSRYGGYNVDSAHSIQQTFDGGYIVAGLTHSFGEEGNLWVLKLDKNLNVQWKKTYGGSKGEDAYSIRPTSDGG